MDIRRRARLRLASAWAAGQRPVPGQPACEAKSNKTTDAGHGRVETRRFAVSHEGASCRPTAAPPGLKSIAMAEAEVERGGETTRERRPYRSLAPDATLFAQAVRAHRRIGDRLRSGHGPQDTATVGHTALNPPRSARDEHSLETRRKSAGWKTRDLETVIQQAT